MMNKVILNDFIAEFNKKYNEKTFSGLEVINNDSLDQSSIFIKQEGSDDQLKQVYSISPMNTKSVNVILSAAAKLLPFDGYYLHSKSSKMKKSFVKLT